VLTKSKAVIQRFERDARVGGLAFGPLVAVDAQLGVVGKVGAELDEEWPEVAVNAVDVVVVDHRGCSHDPWIARARLGVAALLGPERRRLLLRLADEQHSFLSADDANVAPRWSRKKPTTPDSYCSLGTYRFRYIRSTHSTSKVTCPDRTSAALRAIVMTGSGRQALRGHQPLRAVQRRTLGSWI